MDGKLRSTDEAERSARKTRLSELESLLAHIAPDLAKGTPTVVVGDFNEPSCEDWTTATVLKRTGPELACPVDWPCSRFLLRRGFVDAYRAIYPDPVAKPGYTWTPCPDRRRSVEVMDRIDLIYSSFPAKKVLKVQILGGGKGRGEEEGVAVEPWTSDHRAVAAEFDI